MNTRTISNTISSFPTRSVLEAGTHVIIVQPEVEHNTTRADLGVDISEQGSAVSMVYSTEYIRCDYTRDSMYGKPKKTEGRSYPPDK